MAYATRDYYISGYLQGRSPAVPDADFLFWEKQAERIVDSYTFDRIKANDSLLTDDVKDCTCELTELLYRADKASQSTSDFGGPLTSYSNDGESGTIDLSRSIYTEEGKWKSSAGIWEIRHCFIGGCENEPELQSDNYSLPEGWNGVEQECVRAMFLEVWDHRGAE